MNSNFHIERSILASVLCNVNCISFDLDPNHFSNPFHRKLVNGINRLKELDMPIDFEILSKKFIDDRKWSVQEHNALYEMLTHTSPFGSQEAFDNYYEILKKSYKLEADRRFAI